MSGKYGNNWKSYLHTREQEAAARAATANLVDNQGQRILPLGNTSGASALEIKSLKGKRNCAFSF